MDAKLNQSLTAMDTELRSPPAILQKANETLVLALRKGRLTVTARKLYNVLLHRSQQELFEAEKSGRPIQDPTHLFRASMTELLEYIKRDIQSGDVDAEDLDDEERANAVAMRGSKSDPRTAIKSYFIEMMSTVVEWQEPAGAVKWKAMPILAMAQEEQEKGQRIMFAWRHQAEVFQTLARKSGYTPINIECVTRLETYEAIALYEICARYRGFVYQTTKHDPDWWQKALSRAANRKLRDWRLFKNQKLKPAVEQINRLTDLEIELVEEREGGKPKGKLLTVQFLVKRRENSEAVAPRGPRFSEELLKKASSLSVPTSFLINCSLAGTSQDALSLALDKLSVRLSKADLPPVESPSAYMRKLLEEINDVIEVKAKSAPSTTMSTPTAFPTGAKLSGEIENPRRQKVQAALDAMSAEELNDFGDMVFQSIQPMARKTLLKDHTQKNWRKPMFWALIVKAKGDEMFGSDWQTVDAQGTAV